MVSVESQRVKADCWGVGCRGCGCGGVIGWFRENEPPGWHRVHGPTRRQLCPCQRLNGPGNWSRVCVTVCVCVCASVSVRGIATFSKGY